MKIARVDVTYSGSAEARAGTADGTWTLHVKAFNDAGAVVALMDVSAEIIAIALKRDPLLGVASVMSPGVLAEANTKILEALKSIGMVPETVPTLGDSDIETLDDILRGNGSGET